MAAPPQVGPDPGSGVNWKTTLTMLGLVVGLGLWVWLGDQEIAPVDPSQESKQLLPHLKAHDVIRLEVEREGEETLVLSRSALDTDETAVTGPQGWKIEQPLADGADDAIVARLLNALEFAPWIERIAPAQAGEVEFGDTQMTLRLHRKHDKPTYTLTFGQPQPSGVTAVKVEGRQDLFLVHSLLGQAIPADLWTYRHKVMFNAPRDVLTSFELTRPSLTESPGREQEEIRLLKQEGVWRLGQDGDYAAKSLVNQLVDLALGLQAVASETDDPSDDDLQRLGLAPQPWARLVLGLPDDLPGARQDLPRRQELLIGAPVPENKGLRYARYGDRPYVYRVEMTELVRELTQRPSSEFHSNVLLPLQGTESTVTGLGVHFTADDAWRLQRKKSTWIFEGEGEVKASPGPTQELVRTIVRLESERLIGHQDDVDLAGMGLKDSTFWIELVDGKFRHQVNVGHKVQGKPGHYYMLRLTDGRVFEVDLGLLPQRLKATPLELLDRRIFRASSFDSQRIQITDHDGTVRLDVTRVAADGETLEHWRVDGPPALQTDPDTDLIQRFADLFDQVNVDRYMAHDSEGARANYGLDAPTQVTITVATYDDEGQDASEDRTLLLGRREGLFVYALNPRQGVVGRIDASFLDRLERGFSKGETVLALDRWSVGELIVEQEGVEIMRLTRHGQNWKRDNLELVTDREELEALLAVFEELQITRTDLATSERKAEVGLTSPHLKFRFTMLPVGEEQPVTKTLLIGASMQGNSFEVWATSETNGQPHDKLGTLFHKPLRAIEIYIEGNPAPSYFPPVDKRD